MQLVLLVWRDNILILFCAFLCTGDHSSARMCHWTEVDYVLLNDIYFRIHLFTFMALKKLLVLWLLSSDFLTALVIKY